MTGHLAMELPTHLPESLFALEFFASLVKVLNLDSVVLLVAFVAKLSELLFHSFLFVPA